MITYQIEALKDIWGELDPLFRDHYAECDGGGEFNINVGLYLSLAGAGSLTLHTVRDSGVVVGYFVVMTGPNPIEYPDILVSSGPIYIKPEYRSSSVAYRLFTEALGRAENTSGLSKISVHIPLDSPAGGILSRWGYKKTEEVWEKRGTDNV